MAYLYALFLAWLSIEIGANMFDPSLKGGRHGKFHSDIFVPVVSLGDAETENNIFLNF